MIWTGSLKKNADYPSASFSIQIKQICILTVHTMENNDLYLSKSGLETVDTQVWTRL